MNFFNLKFQKSKYLYQVVFMIMATLFIWGAAEAPAATGITTVEIADRVEIDQDEILLGQIARIEGNDIQLIQKLKGIVIGKAPLPGKSRQYDQRYLKMRLKQSKINLSGLNLQVPARIEISRRHIEIRQEKIKQIVTDFIMQNSPQENRRVFIKAIRVPESVLLPTGRVTYKLVAPRNGNLMGKVPIAVDFSVDGHFREKVWTTATVEVWGQVVVTRKPLGRHKAITEDDIQLQTVDLANVPSNVITDSETVLGKRTKRAIGMQTVLRADLIELPYLVKRGDLVVIIAETEGFRITTLGHVKKKGRQGDRIPVVNVDSRKVLYARVIDSNTVRVDL
jgi:flagella basal body P-ring formation protein FlgA